MKGDILKIVAITLLLKITYFCFAFVVSALDSNYDIACNETELVALFKRNDAAWYQRVADEGYPKITNPSDLGYSNGKDVKQSVWAFFPLYPLSVRYFGSLFGLDFDHSAFLLSLVFGATCFISFYFICIHVFKKPRKESFIATLFFMCFPFNYYYSMYYTEAVFFTLLAFAFVFIAQKKYGLASILFVPLVLVRPNGIVSLLPLFLYYIEVEGGFKAYLDYLKTWNWKKLGNMLYFISGPIALGLYCLYQKHMTNHYFAFAKAQAGWDKDFMFPLLGLFRQSSFATQFNSVYAIIFMIIGIFAWKKLPLSLNLLIWINILLPLSSGSAAGMPRYVSIAFPLTILLISSLTVSRFKYLILVGFLLIQLLTFYPWVIGDPFSF
jgi:Gpi18-like mannosyltransferase